MWCGVSKVHALQHINVLAVFDPSNVWSSSIVSSHGVMDCQISCSSQCTTAGVTKSVSCAIQSGMVNIKDPLLLIGKRSS